MKYQFVYLIISIFVLICGCINLQDHDYASFLEGIEIGIKYSHDKLFIEDIGINKSLFSKFDDDTLKLQILLNNNIIVREFNYYKDSTWLYSPDNEFHIENHDLPYNYYLSFHYVLNSNYSDVRNISFFGINNYFNLSVILKGENELTFPSKEISDFDYILIKSKSHAEIIISRHQQYIKENSPKAHVFYIRPYVVQEN